MWRNTKLTGCCKVAFRGKFTTPNGCIGKEDRVGISHVSFFLRYLEKEQQIKAKGRRIKKRLM